MAIVFQICIQNKYTQKKYIKMVVIIGLEGSANKIGIGIIEDGKVCI